MLSHTVLLALVAAVGAVPLNINLGAYSPALVVGDGEISLGAAGAAGASELMATLAQGAQQGAAGEAAQQGQQANQQGEAAQQEQQQGEAQPAEQQEQPAEGEAAKRGNLVRDINKILKREAAPEPAEVAHIDAVAAAVQWIKRDINSFNSALSYAERAQQNQPKIELGTGEEGSGVGITVNAGLNVPANSAANGAAAPGGERARKAKRSEVVEDDEAPKMTLVAITEV
ncbi:uncharacterized protein N0V89_006802 [Didymosphaeria variabile]|uniref:Uncharacterized protein n=1 Tax=Didymosphaeria variabile TaxID=1932322 RepID=A0A9W9C9K5_9PLEO|nr:uncharacterized protein N0V89_006802 [Didymosphaeria variabile]KAJ4351460.1 hypothetical protein N0V89_006802 [Didymosphaeria variabile]